MWFSMSGLSSRRARRIMSIEITICGGSQSMMKLEIVNLRTIGEQSGEVCRTQSLYLKLTNYPFRKCMGLRRDD